MRLHLQVSEAHCECGLFLTSKDGTAACPRFGRLTSRGQAPERTLACAAKRVASALQRNVAGHEHCSNRSPRHQSGRVRPSTPSRCSIGRGHHHSARSHSRVSSMLQCRDHEWSRLASCACREGDKIRRRGYGRAMVKRGNAVHLKSWRLARPGKHHQ